MGAPVQAKTLCGMSNQLNLRIGGASRGDAMLCPIENEDSAIHRKRGNDVGVLWLVTGLVHLARMIDLLDKAKFDDHRLTRQAFGTVPANLAEVEIPKTVEPNPQEYDEERGEIGGYGAKGSSGEPMVIKFNIVQKIDHPGEVNKARYQPQNPDIIATLAIDGRVLIFDRTKHSITPTGVANAQVELHGHTSEGFGLDWNPHDEGCLASGSEDHTVLLWYVFISIATYSTLAQICLTWKPGT